MKPPPPPQQHTLPSLSSPRMSDGLLAGVSFLCVQVHEVADEVLGRVRDIVPIGRVKLIVPSHDLLEQLCIVLVIEWRIATQTGRQQQ